MSILAALPAVASLLDRILPDPEARAQAKLDMMKLAQSGELALLDADTKIAQGQAALNLEDAKAGGLFRAGWRPFLGWSCAVAVAWEWVAKPVFVVVWMLSTPETLPPLPVLSMEQIIGLVVALLGLGGMRSVERIKGKT